MPWRCSRAASRRAATERGLRRAVAARAGQQRVHARGAARQLHVLRQRARVLPGDRGHDVARAVRRELRAEHDRAAREVAAQPGGAAHDLVRVELVGLGAQLLEERAAQVLLDLLLGLLDGDLGERRDGGEVQELERVLAERGGLAEREHVADHLVAGGDRHLGRDAGRALLAPVADVAAEHAARRRRRRGLVTAAPRRGTTIATSVPAASAASSATRPSPSPPSTASTISRWTPRSRSTSVA